MSTTIARSRCCRAALVWLRRMADTYGGTAFHVLMAALSSLLFPMGLISFAIAGMVFHTLKAMGWFCWERWKIRVGSPLDSMFAFDVTLFFWIAAFVFGISDIHILVNVAAGVVFGFATWLLPID